MKKNNVYCCFNTDLCACVFKYRNKNKKKE